MKRPDSITSDIFFSPFRWMAGFAPAMAMLLSGVALLGTARAAPGDLDPLDASVVGSWVYASAVQPDGKTIIAGNFTSVLGVPRNHIARLNPDGTLDTGFNPKPNSDVWCVAVQADGKVLLGGNFTTLQPNGAASPTTRNRIARVNADGTLDTGFNPNANGTVQSVVLQADGKILLGGGFGALQPNGAASATTRNYIARVNADGTLDTGFNPNTNNPIWGGTVHSLAVQADGKVLLGGEFTTLQPNGAASATARNYIARVNADGTLDTGFNPNASDFVTAVAVQADGKVLLSGNFTTLQPNGAASATTRNYIARVNVDGTLDTGFDPNANGPIKTMAVQTDGKLLIGGMFTTVRPNGAASPTTRNYIARINPNGTLDVGFDPNASNWVECVVVQADGKLLLGGRFAQFSPYGGDVEYPRNRFARLLNDPATQTLAAASSAQVTWTRGGSAPEVSQVLFELSTDGGASYTALPGTAARMGTTPNWQLSGLSLPTSGVLRARGRATGGFQNGSSGIIEHVVTFSFPNPEIAVTESAANVANGGSLNFGASPVGTPVTKTFTVTNTGTSNLNLIGNPLVTVTGSPDFTVITQPESPIAGPGGSSNFTVRFAPTGSGLKSASLSIPNNDDDEHPFVIHLTGVALSLSADSDGDGLNDAAEFNMAALGFNWQVNQPALVAALSNGANSAGLYTTSQVQALHVGAPLLERNPNTGQFKLTISLKKSTDLINYTPFPFTAPQTSLNGEGKIEFLFTSPDNATFFRVGAD